MKAVVGRFSAHPEIIHVSGCWAWPSLGFAIAKYAIFLMAI